MDDNKTLTYGERTSSFNPTNDEWVNRINKHYAAMINQLSEHRDLTDSPEKKRLLSIVITEIEKTQPQAVKAITLEV